MRSLEGGGGLAEPHERPVVRSFVEAVLTAAIISPESRMHQRPWQNVAHMRGVQCDSLGALLSRPTVPKKSHGDPLIVDISWLLERVLEIVSIPNAVTISPEDPQSIINLDKRRSGFLFILGSECADAIPQTLVRRRPQHANVVQQAWSFQGRCRPT